MSDARQYNGCQSITNVAIFKGTLYRIARRFERVRKSKDDANARMLAAIRRAEHPESKEEQ